MSELFLVCFEVCMSISDKTDKILLNYSDLFYGPLFMWIQCTIAEANSKDQNNLSTITNSAQQTISNTFSNN